MGLCNKHTKHIKKKNEDQYLASCNLMFPGSVFSSLPLILNASFNVCCINNRIPLNFFSLKWEPFLGFLTAGCWRDITRGRGCPWNFYQESKVSSMAVRSSCKVLPHPRAHSAVPLEPCSLIRQQPFYSLLYLETRAPFHSYGLKDSYLHLCWDSHYKPTLPAANVLPSCWRFTRKFTYCSPEAPHKLQTS